MATSFHEHVYDHVSVHELRPALTLGVAVVVDVHEAVVGFFMRLGCALFTCAYD